LEEGKRRIPSGAVPDVETSPLDPVTVSERDCPCFAGHRTSAGRK
jgi:hypothetical protein